MSKLLLTESTVNQKWIDRQIDDIPDSSFLPSVVDFTMDRRYVSRKTSPMCPGQYNWKTAPHMRKIMEFFHPDNPKTHCDVMKSVQSGFTFATECGIAFNLYYAICNTGFYTADLKMVERRSKANIDPMIDDTRGLAEKVKPFSTRNKRKQGDSTYMKEFSGGVKLTLDSYGTISGMKSHTMELIIGDEADECPPEIRGQGDTLATIEGRAKGVRHPKIIFGSTPSDMETSVIYARFILGDQQYFNVQCPLCGELSVMEFRTPKMKHGFTYLCDPGTLRVIPDTIGYTCKYCKGLWRESKKQQAMLNGLWIPTAVPDNPLRESYHISSLMSPENMLPWKTVAMEDAATDNGKNIPLFKQHVINNHGKPWKRVLKKSDPKVFMAQNLMNYVLGIVPECCLILFGGADVQKDRIEYCVVGFGPGGIACLVDHAVFHGNVADPNDLAWTSFSDYCYNTLYTIQGQQVTVTDVAIDCGYDPKEYRSKDWNDKAHTVYNFCGDRLDKFVPVRGSGNIKSFDIVRAARTENPFCPKVYMLNSSLLKDITSRNIRPEDEEALPLVYFPRYQLVGKEQMPIDQELIEQLLSERYQEIEPGKFAWKKHRSRNELWDTFLYATALTYYRKVNSWSAERWKRWKEDLIE